nr:Uncharacterised protein [Streptococcus thermophilus]
MINLILAVVILAFATFSVSRRKSSSTGLLSSLFSVLVVYLLARGVNWNGDAPVFVWWLLAAWSAVLVGMQASRLGDRTTASAGRAQS